MIVPWGINHISQPPTSFCSLQALTLLLLHFQSPMPRRLSTHRSRPSGGAGDASPPFPFFFCVFPQPPRRIQSFQAPHEPIPAVRSDGHPTAPRDSVAPSISWRACVPSRALRAVRSRGAHLGRQWGDVERSFSFIESRAVVARTDTVGSRESDGTARWTGCGRYGPDYDKKRRR